jgi:hypothetical protein
LFAEQVEYLGFWINRQDIQSISNKVEAILNINAPKIRNHNKLRQFIGIVNYYCNIWFRISELLVPLTSLIPIGVKFERHSSHQQAFDKVKIVIETEVLLCYPDFNEPFLFHLHTDASDHHWGGLIMQDEQPIDFYSRKLNTAQKWNTTTERRRELLSAIETCKEYKNIL